MSWVEVLANVALFVHDWITRIFYYLAALGLVAMCGLYCMEVVLRYFLNSPTTWSTDVITFTLLISVFSAIPCAVKSAMHVAVTLVIDVFKGIAPYVGAFLNIAGMILCGFVGYISLKTTMEQYAGNVGTGGSFEISKWMLTAFITYGFVNSALWHLRLLLTGQTPIQSELATITAEGQ
jgi:TRAP-type C4-dicarboxylate transport system permease small subunit